MINDEWVHVCLGEIWEILGESIRNELYVLPNESETVMDGVLPRLSSLIQCAQDCMDRSQDAFMKSYRKRSLLFGSGNEDHPKIKEVIRHLRQ